MIKFMKISKLNKQLNPTAALRVTYIFMHNLINFCIVEITQFHVTAAAEEVSASSSISRLFHQEKNGEPSTLSSQLGCQPRF